MALSEFFMNGTVSSNNTTATPKVERAKNIYMNFKEAEKTNGMSISLVPFVNDKTGMPYIKVDDAMWIGHNYWNWDKDTKDYKLSWGWMKILPKNYYKGLIDEGTYDEVRSKFEQLLKLEKANNAKKPSVKKRNYSIVKGYKVEKGKEPEAVSVISEDYNLAKNVLGLSKKMTEDYGEDAAAIKEALFNNDVTNRTTWIDIDYKKGNISYDTTVTEGNEKHKKIGVGATFGTPEDNERLFNWDGTLLYYFGVWDPEARQRVMMFNDYLKEAITCLDAKLAGQELPVPAKPERKSQNPDSASEPASTPVVEAPVEAAPAETFIKDAPKAKKTVAQAPAEEEGELPF